MASYEKKCGPPNWNVRSHKRSNGMYDRIYYEPGTGKEFRSRKKAWARFHETKKLLAERVFHVSPGVPFGHDVSPAVHSPAVQNITEAQKREKMASYEKKCAPPNWNVRSHKRSNGMYDRIYYEPGTGKEFRSRKKAWARFHETKKLLAERVFHVSPGVPFGHDVSPAVHSTAVQNITEAQKREKMASYEKKCGPPNWNVRSHKRSNGMYDRIYYEPGTGKEFRSRKKAWARFHETKKLLAERVFHVSPGVPFGHDASPAVHSPAVQNITEAQKREVEDFLRDAWTNFLNKE